MSFLILGVSIIIAALVFGFFYQTRASRDYIQVLGAATEGFESDIVNIRQGYSNIQEKRDRRNEKSQGVYS